MAKLSFIALCSLVVLLLTLPADALAAARETTEERIFNLIVGREISDTEEEEIVVVAPYIPAIESGKLDLTFTLGYFFMEKTLFRYNRILFKATQEHYFLGNVRLKNTPGFSPSLRLGYTLAPWLALEAQTGISFSQFEGTITAPYKRNRLVRDTLEKGEVAQFDPEKRSVFSWINNLNAIWYLLNTGGDGRGRLHPYAIGGVGYALYELDSAYTDTRAGNLNLSAGAGLVLIVDRQIRIRAEAVFHRHQIQFQPAEYFDVRDQETFREPVFVFDEVGNEARVTSYPKRTLSGLAVHLGFSAQF